jgi:hypothetical protein
VRFCPCTCYAEFSTCARRSLRTNRAPDIPIPAGAQSVPLLHVPPQALERVAAGVMSEVRALVPEGFQITAMRTLSGGTTGVTVFMLNNIGSARSEVEKQRRLIVAEYDGPRYRRVFTVFSRDGSVAGWTGEAEGAYRRQHRTYILTRSFTRGVCFEGLVGKVGDRYLYHATQNHPAERSRSPLDLQVFERLLDQALPQQRSVGEHSWNAFGKDAVWNPSEQALKQMAQNCGSIRDPIAAGRCVASEMQGLGASNQAIAFTQLLKSEVYMTHFHESGKVDFAEVCPFTYNSPELCEREVFVNGIPRIVDPFDHIFTIGIRNHPSYPPLARRFPDVRIHGRYSFRLKRSLPGGRQRFVYDLTLVNGCRACEIAGEASIGFDFDRQGRFIGVRLLELRGPNSAGSP